jgi:phage/plasmid-associated DNA primase
MVAFPYLANFPEEEDPDTVQRALLVHLDTMMGDIRQVQSVMRALGALMCNTRFADQLDTSHEHLIPFANGVLDLDALELRPGRPEDFVMRGPTYAWIDYDADDAVVSEMEYMLTTIFPDRAVRAFFLEVGGTLLRRRNRFKHFYVMTAWSSSITRGIYFL